MLTNNIVGKTRYNFALWESEKYSYEDILRKVKGCARSKKLDKEASTSKAGVALGNVQSQEEEQWGEQGDWEWEDINADINAVGSGKSKGK